MSVTTTKCISCVHKDVCKHEGILEEISEQFKKLPINSHFENSKMFGVYFDCKKYQDKYLSR